MDRPLLVIEDASEQSLGYPEFLAREGFVVTYTHSLEDGRQLYEGQRPSVVILDMSLAGGEALAFMKTCLEIQNAAFVIITSSGLIARAVEAMRHGAHEFVVKPFDQQNLLTILRRAQAKICAKVIEEKSDPEPQDQAAQIGIPGLIGNSAPMQKVYNQIHSAAKSMATVFIHGESGTGKELCAQAIHNLSPRASGPFVPLNCGGIPADLLESEVFGHLKGAFTGAIGDRQGAAALADGGTLFLDEICELDLNLQTKLLRFLQTSTITPVGTAKSRKVDVRIVCATNRDPTEEVKAGRFRADLFYRLHVVPVQMPALRQRGEDIMDIAERTLQNFAAIESRSMKSFAPEVIKAFLAHPWPGNVRQLLNVLQNVVVMHDGETVTLDMLPQGFLDESPVPPAASPSAAADVLTPQNLIGLSLAEIERAAIEATISYADGSIPKAARLLGVSPSTIYRKRESWAQSDPKPDESPA
ncbi:MAG: sigma-54-dependent transcriptional regulator [Mangrovicoccus sp.]